MCFDGIYEKTIQVPTTGKDRNVIIVEDAKVKSILASIASTVESKDGYPSKVWKGITCPGYGSFDDKFKLWVPPSDDPNFVQGNCYRFQVERCEVIQLSAPERKFEYCVNIHVNLLSD